MEKLTLGGRQAAEGTPVSYGYGEERRQPMIRIAEFDDKADHLDGYLAHFERLAADQNIPRERWAANLATCLSNRARSAYAMLTGEEASDYDAVTAALYEYFEVTPEKCLEAFRRSSKGGQETHKQFHHRVGVLFDRWVKREKIDRGYNDLRELILREQVIGSYSSEFKVFLLEQGYTTLSEVAVLAERYEAAHPRTHRPSKTDSTQLRNKPNTAPTLTSPAGNASSRHSNLSRYTTDHKQTSMHKSNQSTNPWDNTTSRCFKCDRPGHFARDCTEQANSVATIGGNLVFIDAQVNGEPVRCMLDTGLTLEALVDPGLVREGDYLGESIQLAYANGASETVPLARVTFESEQFQGKLVAGVQPNAIHRASLGCQRILQHHLIGTSAGSACAVETRAAKRVRAPEPLHAPDIPLTNTDPREMKRLQSEDPTLREVWKKVGNREEGEEMPLFEEKDGLLTRNHRTKDETFRQLVVPESRRATVMELAHDSLGSGHLGVTKTQERVKRYFYWPGVNAEVKRFVKSCDQCQRLGLRREKPAPLHSMPIIDQPFRRVGVDIVGPMTPSSRGHRYMVTTIDYATRYADVVPVKNVQTQTVAEALFTIWSRVGVPEEILTDRGTQFVGEVMGEVNRLLSINHLTTTPYHPQTNGLVERFHGTLKAMLRKCCELHPREWDRYLPAILFAYREVPQSSLGFSPFELLYGRQVRGPMAILRQVWTDDHSEPPVQTTYEYVTQMRDKLEAACESAKEHLEAVQTRQAAYFNKKAKNRTFQPGDEVLLLLPEKHNKLLMGWKGPFIVEEVKGESNYVIRRSARKVATYHVNMLKRYLRRPAGASAVVASIIPEVISEEDSVVGPVLSPPLTAVETTDDCHLSDSLNEAQREEVSTLLREFPDVLSERPGKTNLAEFGVRLISDEPTKAKPYPLPHSKQETVRAEIREMLELGVIERVESPYAAPVVLVSKRDGTNRFCVDYRRLNAITVFQTEALPDPEAIFARIHNAKYFSKVDLSKGYWQIPVKPEDREKLAFITQDGTYTWTVMPFGVKTAPSAFTVMMRRLLEPLAGEPVENFMDDLLIASETWDDHLRAWRAVLERLREAGLTARPTKCFIGFDELEYLGHQLAEGRISPGKGKLQELKEAERPKTRKGVRAFLGLAGYYRRFVPNFSKLSAPLTDLLKKGQPDKVKWTPECEEAFRALKESLCSGAVLKLADLGREFVLRTDASDVGVGAALLQEHQGILHPVAYASRKLNGAERRYSVSERECLAIVFATQKFQRYLYGREFVLETDHEPLAYLAQAKHTSSRLMRWSLQLQEYPMRLRYIKGSENVTADYLSRCQGEQ